MALEAEIAAKNAHVQEMVYALRDLLNTIDNGRSIWYGGFPQTISSIESFSESNIARLTEAFQGVVDAPRPDPV